LGSAGLVAAASHWALNDSGPSKLLAEELIKILLRTQ
jgi:phage gp16-like protein